MYQRLGTTRPMTRFLKLLGKIPKQYSSNTPCPRTNASAAVAVLSRVSKSARGTALAANSRVERDSSICASLSFAFAWARVAVSCDCSLRACESAAPADARSRDALRMAASLDVEAIGTLGSSASRSACA